MGNFSVHHIHPSFFLGFEPVGTQKIKMAIPEKALLDFLYLYPAKSKLFHALPEIELPPDFSLKTAQELIRHLDSGRQRISLKKRLEKELSLLR